MKLKKLASNTINFSVNRLIEIIGLIILVTGIMLLASLVTFSPNDPNFVFPNNTEIKNILGFQNHV